MPYQAFSTSDSRFLIVGAGNDAQFVTLCQLLDLPSLATDSRFVTNGDRVLHRSTLIPLLADRFAQETLDHWLSVFQGCVLPYGPVNNMEQVFRDPQVLHNEMVWEFDHPAVGKVKTPGHPVVYKAPGDSQGMTENETANDSDKRDNKMELDSDATSISGVANNIVESAPLLGQHTDWVLENVAGCSPEEIASLREMKAVF